METKYDSILGQLRESDNSSDAFYFKNSAGVESYRLIMRADILQLDKTLTEIGFSGTEDTDWLNINSFQ